MMVFVYTRSVHSVANILHDGSGTNCEPDERFNMNNELVSGQVPVTAIPLQTKEGMRKAYIRLHPAFKYRFILL